MIEDMQLMKSPQPGILAPVPDFSCYLELTLLAGVNPVQALGALAELTLEDGIVIGIGPALAPSIKPLHAFPASSGSGFEVPSTQADVWCWIRGGERDPVTRLSPGPRG